MDASLFLTAFYLMASVVPLLLALLAVAHVADVRARKLSEERLARAMQTGISRQNDFPAGVSPVRLALSRLNL